MGRRATWHTQHYSSQSVERENMTIQIIGAGLGRTGTSSLKLALEQLGYAPCYHMREFFQHPDHAQAWLDAAEGKPVDWPKLFGDFQATVDFPGCSFYQELMKVYPNAKVILSVREAEAWYESTYETIFQMPQVMPRWLRVIPAISDIYSVATTLVWEKHFGGRFGDRAYAIDHFNAWNREVEATVPAGKLLVFDVKQGWEPLCAFLGVPVPEGPFPHANDRAEMMRAIAILRGVKKWTPVALGVILAALIGLWVAARQSKKGPDTAGQ
jgi:hypothetical protein